MLYDVVWRCMKSYGVVWCCMSLYDVFLCFWFLFLLCVKYCYILKFQLNCVLMCCLSWHFLLKSGRLGPNCPDFIHFSWLLVAVSYFLLLLIGVLLFLKFFTPRWRFVPCFLEQVVISWQAFLHYFRVQTADLPILASIWTVGVSLA